MGDIKKLTDSGRWVDAKPIPFWTWTTRFEFKPQDLWIGAFWKRGEYGRLDIWICLLPMLPLHISNYED